MRILGIDPGSAVTGWGVIENDGRKTRHIAHGCVRTKSGAPLADRLGAIFLELQKVIDQHGPQQAAVEMVFMAKNAQSAIKLGHARGAAITAIVSRNMPVYEYSALQVKKSVVGYGRAEKHQVGEMIRMILTLPKAPAQDAADALGVALCHFHTASSPDFKLRLRGAA
ncbi:MAG: crossover junction endodeoxyribonuclease RuvC [Magnetococcales bacterium]|nr:crossover junction endodeoxyribonuclease RuvC [Magnetococcales bacterium]